MSDNKTFFAKVVWLENHVELVGVWPRWLRWQFSQLRPNWPKTNSSSGSLGNQFALERGGKGESMEQVLFREKPNFDKSSANFPPRITIRWLNIDFSSGRVAFEKLTDLDYKGETYYTIRCLLNHDQSSSWSSQWPIMMKCSRNLSLYECQGWCREEPECQAASFRWQNHLHRQIKSSPTSCLLLTWHNNYLYTNSQRDKVIFTETIIIQIFFWFFLQLFSFVVNPLTPRQETICLLQVKKQTINLVFLTILFSHRMEPLRTTRQRNLSKQSASITW